MPFKSKAQMRWMFANHPEMAKRWADHTPSTKKLPNKVEKEKEAAFSFVDKNIMPEIVKQAVNNVLKGRPQLNPQPTSPTPNVQKAPNIVAQNQYGSNLQQTVKDKALQLQQPAKKANFLEKLANPPAAVPAPAPPTAIPVPPTTPTAPTLPPAPSGGPALPTPPASIAGDLQPPVVPPLDLTPGRALPTEPTPLGNSSWTKSVTTGAIPSNLASRLHLQTPDERREINALYNLREFAPHLSGKLTDPSAAVTSKDIQDMHNYHQQRFMEYVQAKLDNGAYERPELAADFNQGSPHIFDIMSGRQGTTGQQYAAQEYLKSLEKAKENLVKGRGEMAKAKAEEVELDKPIAAAKANDAMLKDWTGTNIRELADLGVGLPFTGDYRSYNAKDRGWGDFASQAAGTGFNVAMSPAGTAALTLAGAPAFGIMRGGAGLLPTVTRSIVRPYQAGALARALAGTAGYDEDQKNTIGQVAQFGTSIPYAYAPLLRGTLTGLASGTPLGIASGLGQGALTGYLAKNDYQLGKQLYNDLPYMNELRTGTPNYKTVDQIAAADNLFNSTDVEGSNMLPNLKDFNEKLKGTPSYAVSGKFNFGTLESNPAVKGLDSAVRNLDKLPADKRAAEATRIGQVVGTTFGATFDEYQGYVKGSDMVTTARSQLKAKEEAYDALMRKGINNEVDDASRVELEKQIRKSQNDLVIAQQTAAQTSLPFVTKAMDKRYQTEIKPMEAQVGDLVGKVEGIRAKMLSNQPMTNEDAAIVRQAQDFMNISKDYAFEKARLEFMRTGSLANPGVDGIFSQPSQQGFNTLSELLSGKNEIVYGADGQPVMMNYQATNGEIVKKPLTKNSNMLINSAKMKFENQVDEIYKGTGGAATAANLDYNNPVQYAPGLPGAPGTGGPGAGVEDQSIFSQIKALAWDGMPDWARTLIFGGLALGTVAALGSMFGGGGKDDDEEGGGSSWLGLLGMLGIGAAVGLPLAKYMGFGDMLGLGGNEPTGNRPSDLQPNVTGQQATWNDPMKVQPGNRGTGGPAPGPAFDKQKLRETVRKDPAAAGKMVGEYINSGTRSGVEYKDKMLKLDWAFNRGLSDGVISRNSDGQLTPDDVAMLRANWQHVKPYLR